MGVTWGELGRILSVPKNLTGAAWRISARRRGKAAKVLRSAIEGLEDRCLLSVLPAPTVVTNVLVEGPGNNQNLNSPSVAYDPTNPLKMVSVYARNDPGANGDQNVFVSGSFSVNGGVTWTPFAMPPNLPDATTSTQMNQANFARASEPSVGFDRLGNFYVTYREHSADDAAGVIVLQKFEFTGAAPAQLVQDQVLYSWAQNDAAYNPTIAVNGNRREFIDPVTGAIQLDPTVDPNTGQGPVYVAWVQNDTAPMNAPNGFNPNPLRIVSSTDGGVNFSTSWFVNDDEHTGPRNAAPRMVISQGTATVAPGTARVPGGQLTVIWDDFTSGDNAQPDPLDFIRSDRVLAPARGFEFPGTGGPVADATDPGNGMPHVAGVTEFAIPVSVTPGFVVEDVNVQVTMEHGFLDQVSMSLVAPNGTTVSLIRNRIDVDGMAVNPARGIGGVNLGLLNGIDVGTVFDDDAARDIDDGTAIAPFTSSFQPETGGLNALNGMAANVANGMWRLVVTDFRVDGQSQPQPDRELISWSLAFSSELATDVDVEVTRTRVLGNAPGQAFARIAPVSPDLGIGPSASIASDNTLGSFSPFQGRLYVAYTGHPGGTAPVDNTDVYLATSDDGGVSWVVRGATPLTALKISDDVPALDGFSEGNRAQFMPETAVDPKTGTLVVSYYDARHDAARARVARYIATSIDGGGTFGDQMFANAPNQAFDAITQTNVIIGPLPDNQSSGNAARDTAFGFGSRQGIIAVDGKVIPVWAGNRNNGGLGIQSAVMNIAAGPRVESSTMGPVSLPGDALNPAGANGSPQFTAIDVTFDRPIDPTTFTPTDVTVRYRNANTAGSQQGVLVNVLGVTPLNAGLFGPAGIDGATQFRVIVEPQTGTGTYSYSIGPDISDGIRSTGFAVTVVGTTTYVASGANVNLRIPPLGDGGSGVPSRDITNSVISISGVPAGEVIGDVNVKVSLTHTFDGDLALTLITPGGTRIPLSLNHGGPDNDFIDTVFDDSAALAIATGLPPFTGSFRPDQPLNVLFGATPNGDWTLEIDDQLGADIGTLTAWSLIIQTGAVGPVIFSGNRMDQNTNAVGAEIPQAASSIGDVYAIPRPTSQTSFNGEFFTAPFAHDTLPIIVPGPHVLSTNVPGVPPTADNLVLNGTVSSIDVVFDRDMDPATFTAADVLRIHGPVGVVNGPFTVSANPNNDDADPAFPRRFRIGFPAHALSGSYILKLSSDIKSKQGESLDQNLNAGVDQVREVSATTIPVTFNSTNVPAQLGDPLTANKVTTSTLTINDAFVIKQITVQLDITHTFDPDLTAVLIAPNGSRITLFDAVGNVGTRRNFENTVFDDAATTPVQNGGAPFFGRFNPQQPLSVLVDSLSSAGTWTLEITDSAASNVGTLNSWSLTLSKALAPTGLGEPVPDQISASFRIFTQDPTNPLAHQVWTPVGPAPAAGNSGRIGGIAVDPSDPSGNTVYIAGASGGIWKTTNFLTPDLNGPTYVPLTDFGPTFSLNMGGIAVFGRNDDPTQSVIFGATGEGHTNSPGVGFIRSLDGGATWTLLDSTANVDSLGNPLGINSPLRDHVFAQGTTSFKVVVDPRPTPSGEVIVYAALSGANGGIWRSTDTGKHWSLMRAGQATDVVLDLNSGVINAVSNPTGNLDIIYGGFRGEGVFISPNRGQVWNQLIGLQGKPLVRDANEPPTAAPAIPVDDPAQSPNGAKGRVLLAKPELTGNPVQDVQYQGWLYAMVITTTSVLDGLYLTKDFGQNWTWVRIPAPAATMPRSANAIPTNDPNNPDYPIFGADLGQGNYDSTLAVDPNNPNIVYIGGKKDGQGTQVIRIDVTAVSDPHALFLSHNEADGGLVMADVDAAAPVKDLANPPMVRNLLTLGAPNTDPIINLQRNPTAPFLASSTVFVENTERFSNDGTGAKWFPFDTFQLGGNDNQWIFVVRDALSGRARIILGNDHQVNTAVDNNGEFLTNIGTAQVPFGNRTGNLQVSQFYYGAAQPSDLAAQIAGAMFYGHAQDDGKPSSASNILTTGNINWAGGGNRGDSGGVATDQTGSGNYYAYHWPCCGGGNTNFFQVNGVGRTFGLLQAGDDPGNRLGQWPLLGTINFAVNPINGDQIIISSTAGRIFGTTNAGQFWLEIGSPGALDGSQSLAMAFGAPDPNDPTGGLNNLLYVGTQAGNLFVTFTGGGALGNQWLDLSQGLDGSPVRSIVTNPTRGSREAFAITANGVYVMPDSAAPNARWQRIAGNLFNVAFASFGSSLLSEPRAQNLLSLAADWRYFIPDSPTNPTGPSHPVLYVGAEGGVYRSLNKGASWHLFPDPLIDGAPVAGGYLPGNRVTDLDLSLGNIDPTNGRPLALSPIGARSPQLLVASTYGRGTFAIRLAPVITGPVDLNNADDTGSSNEDGISTVRTPRFSGNSQPSAFGNNVRISIVDLTDLNNDGMPDNPAVIGGFDGVLGGPTDTAANRTDTSGNFSNVQIYPNALPEGVRKLGIRASDDAGTIGEVVEFIYNLDLTAPVLTPVAATPEEKIPFTGVVARVDDANPFGTVSINWGDGTISAGEVVSNPNGGFDVIGTHTYTQGGTFNNVVVTVTDPAGNSANVITSANVVEPRASMTGGFTFNAVEGTTSSSQIVATFIDLRSNEALSNYSADINWGDGTTSPGTITFNAGNGLFTVRGSHKYQNPGLFTITTTVHDTGAPDASVTSTANVSDPPVAATGNFTFSAIEGSLSASQTVARFTDPGGPEAVSAYSATINWGDGTTSAGTITFDAGLNAFLVAGAHQYNNHGNFQITTTINTGTAPSSSANSPAVVADPPVIASNGAPITVVEGVATGTRIVATFTDPGGPELESAYTATIIWGDGTPNSVGTIVFNAGTGIFSVNGDHVYNNPGAFSINVIINTGSAPAASASTAVTVTDPPLTGQGGFTFQAQEGAAPAPQILATFSDPGGPEAVTAYVATITWGDGTSSQGTVEQVNGANYRVLATHKFETFGSFAIGISIAHNDTAPLMLTASATVGDPAVIATGGFTFVVDERQPSSPQVVATFVDTGGPEALSHYTASINWGDNTSSEGTITFDVDSGVFSVLGDHTYADSDILPITVTITHDTAPNATGISTATVLDPPVVTIGGFAINGNEDASIGTVIVATFTDPSGAEPLSDYAATINWGDGTTSAGVIAFDNGVFTVTGEHTYLVGGVFNIVTTIDHDLAPDATATSSATITAAPVVAVGGASITGVEGSNTPPQIVATFTDPTGADPISAYSATINWGDGTSSAGTITLDAGSGVFSVVSSHRYNEPGSFVLSITVSHAGSTPQVVSGSATISNPAVIPTGGFTFNATEGNLSATQTVATFVDPGGPEDLSAYSATINWGDGSSSAGTITVNNGLFSVLGQHNYASPGAFNISVTINHGDTAANTQSTAAVVNPAVAVLGGRTIAANEGVAFANTLVATFTDPGGVEALAQYSAQINWGDGTSSAGTITLDAGSGIFSVRGGHTYNDPGDFDITITVSHTGAQDSTAMSSAIVSNPAVVPIPVTFTATEGNLSSRQPVARFTDPGGNESVAQYSADINWGDGTSAAGSITFNGTTGQFTVSGQHTYNDEGQFTITVTIHHNGAPDAVVDSTANVANPAITVTDRPTAIQTAEGATFNGTIVTFDDADVSPDLADFTAMIDWGDGSPAQAATISADSTVARRFNVSGSHIYPAGPNDFTITVTVFDDAVEVGDGTAHVDVNNAAPTPSIAGPETVFVGQQATFTVAGADIDLADAAAGFTYLVTWGDGTSPQTIARTAGNAAGVQVSHNYASAGTFTVQVRATDDDGGSSTRTFSIEIAPPPFVGSFRINGGQRQRSNIDILSFRLVSPTLPVTGLALSSLSLFKGAAPVALTGAQFTFNPANGALLLDLARGLADGLYELDVQVAGGVVVPVRFFRLAGDASGNRVVNKKDERVVRKSLGKNQGQQGFNANADLNRDGKVNKKDLKIVRKNLGHRLPRQ